MFYIMIFWILNKKKMADVFQKGKRYEYSNLTKSEAKGYLDQLKNMMDKEKLYLDPDINLQRVAQKLTILPLYLSQMINENLGQNFSDFINVYRLTEAKNSLLDPKNENLKIIDVALNSGFNSMSSFNAVFKKYNDISPSKFRSLKKISK